MTIDEDISRCPTEDGHEQLAAAGTEESRDAEHFAAAYSEADVADMRLEDDLSGRAVRDRKDVGHFSPDHPRDQQPRVECGRGVRAGAPAIAQHRDPIGDPEDLSEFVRDVDDPYAGCAEPIEDAEENRGLSPGQLRRR